MRRLGCSLLCGALLVFRAPAPLAAQGSCPGGRTALVLAGGGAKGFVHLGVIRMLDSLGVRPDFVVGTSMGAIVGALYASGYSSRDLDSLARELPLGELVRPRTPPPPRAYPLLRPIVYWEIDEGRIRLAPAVVPEQGIDAALNRVLLRGNLQARGDFGRLPLPFYAVATDLATQRAVALHDGDLAQAVRASVAIPLVFEPVRIGDRTLADGGLAANVPVRIARELGATRVIISDMVRRQTTLVDFGNPFTVATALIDYLFSQEGDSAIAGDILIATDVSRIGNLDFSPATLDSLVRRGEREARAVLVPNAACLPHAPPPAQRADSTVERVTRLQVPGFTKRELEDLLGTLGLAQGITLEPDVLRRGFDAFAHDGRFRSVWLNPTPTDSGVALDLHVRRSPTGGIGAGIAYDNELGARMWAGGVLRDPVTKTLELTGVLTVGGLRRDVQAAARRRLYVLGRPSIMASAFVGQEEIPYFTAEGAPFFRPRLSLATGTFGLEWPVGAHWLLRVAGEARAWSDTGKAGHEALGTSFLAQHATPEGEILMLIEAQMSRQFRRAALDWHGPITLGRWTITPAVRAGTAEGGEIPVTSKFPLGGYDGFPGLHLLEHRGDHEIMLSNAVSYALTGPLRVQMELSTGDAREDGPGVRDALLRGEDWLVGWRVGFGMRTSPLGPIRLDYGATSIDGDYRDQVLLRVGRWF
jgi:NTE family protein